MIIDEVAAYRDGDKEDALVLCPILLALRSCFSALMQGSSAHVALPLPLLLPACPPNRKLAFPVGKPELQLQSMEDGRENPTNIP